MTGKAIAVSRPRQGVFFLYFLIGAILPVMVLMPLSMDYELTNSHTWPQIVQAVVGMGFLLLGMALGMDDKQVDAASSYGFMLTGFGFIGWAGYHYNEYSGIFDGPQFVEAMQFVGVIMLAIIALSLALTVAIIRKKREG